MGRRRLGFVIFVDPVSDGLWGTVKLASDLGDGKVLMKHLIDGTTLDFRGVVSCFFRHGIEGIRGILEKETTRLLSTNYRKD